MSHWSSLTTGVVVLPDGRLLRGRALRDRPPESTESPEFGLYLTVKPHKEEFWESHWICWPDFGLPRFSSEAIAALNDAHERAASSRVEIACDGGTGRTGTAIAILARYAGVAAENAV